MQRSLFPQAGASGPSASAPAVRDPRRELNEAQYEAVTAVNGPLLVIAGAGSGKTRTLTYRVAHLIAQGVEPESILLLTFTRKSAEEMLRRAAPLLEGDCRAVTGGTFHSVANMLLRRYGRHLGYGADFTILDRADAEGILNILKSSLELGGTSKRFPSKRVVLNILSKSVNKAMSVEDLLYDEYAHLHEFFADIDLLRDHYHRFKLEHNLMDYDDLLVNWHRVMVEVDGVKEELSRRFRYVMVDEYQDTNPIQAAIVRLLATTHDNVMVVGDDAQSIYSFRGADFRNIMEFPSLFPGTRIIKLEENFRSAQPILELTNEIIALASEKYAKELYSNIVGREKPLLAEARDAAAEARFVVDRLQELHREGVAYGDMAVLFRSGFHSYKLEMELTSRHLPFEKRGGLKLTESAHIKDVLAFFRVLVNGRDHLSWNRILLMLDKVGPKTAANILARIKKSDDPLAALALYPAAPAWRDKLAGLAELLASLREPEMSSTDRYERIMDYYQPIFERIYFEDYPRRSRDIEHLKTIVATYDNLVDLVNDTTLDPPEAEAMAVDPGDRLVLSTVHSAKGLEWDTVVIINLAEGRFPVSSELPEEQMEEERRLLYVAATRAKNRLILTYPAEIVSPDRTVSRGRLSSLLAKVDPALYRVQGRAGYAFAIDEETGRSATSHYPSKPAAGAAKAGDREGRDDTTFKAGDPVVHPFFGPGVIERQVGERTVEVMFDRHGKKVLNLDFARLEPAG